jgi:hypothetical protein
MGRHVRGPVPVNSEGRQHHPRQPAPARALQEFSPTEPGTPKQASSGINPLLKRSEQNQPCIHKTCLIAHGARARQP